MVPPMVSAMNTRLSLNRTWLHSHVPANIVQCMTTMDVLRRCHGVVSLPRVSGRCRGYLQGRAAPVTVRGLLPRGRNSTTGPDDRGRAMW